MTTTDPNDNPRRSRLEDEVLEILARADGKLPLSARARSVGRDLREWATQSRSRIARFDNPWGWFGLAMIVFLVGGALVHGSGLGTRLIQFAGLAAVIIGLVRMFRPSVASGGRKMWRGRPIDMNRRGIELGDKWDEWKRRR